MRWLVATHHNNLLETLLGHARQLLLCARWQLTEQTRSASRAYGSSTGILGRGARLGRTCSSVDHIGGQRHFCTAAEYRMRVQMR